MEIIPVLDLMDGAVVHARMGRRDQYRPIRTPLSPTSAPVDVARGLLSIHPFETLYVADLDAIAGRAANTVALERLKLVFPHLAIWVDNGAADPARVEDWLASGLGHLVLGSEAQNDAALARRYSQDDRIVLSLDFRGDAFVGPQALLDDAQAWPGRVIVMTLARVGSGSGPDVERLSAVKAKAWGKRIYAAGGVRHAADLAMLHNAGIAGALVASSLHNGNLAGAQIARLQDASVERPPIAFRTPPRTDA